MESTRFPQLLSQVSSSQAFQQVRLLAEQVRLFAEQVLPKVHQVSLRGRCICKHLQTDHPIMITCDLLNSNRSEVAGRVRAVLLEPPGVHLIIMTT